MFKRELKAFLMNQAFYSTDEYLVIYLFVVVIIIYFIGIIAHRREIANIDKFTTFLSTPRFSIV